MSEIKTSIQITKATKEELDKLGGKKDTYDDIIVRLLAVNLEHKLGLFKAPRHEAKER